MSGPSPDQAQRTVLYSLLTVGALGTIKSLHKGGMPSVRGALAIAVLGAGLTAAAERAPRLASSGALLILVGSVFSMGADVVDATTAAVDGAPAAAPQVAHPIGGGGGGGTPMRLASYDTGAAGARAAVVALAESLEGTPYLWAGASPSGFDCSGFTQYVYDRAAGVKLYHSAAVQQAGGVAVDEAHAQPGDLVFFGTPAHHCGIYLGGGAMIDAPHTGTVVRVDSIAGNSGFRSYLGASVPLTV